MSLVARTVCSAAALWLLGGGPQMRASQTSQCNDLCEKRGCSVPSSAAAPAVMYTERCQLCCALVTWQRDQQVLYAGSASVLSTSRLTEGPARDLHPNQAPAQPFRDRLLCSPGSATAPSQHADRSGCIEPQLPPAQRCPAAARAAQPPSQ